MARDNGFSFGGIQSRSYGVILRGISNSHIPSRDVERFTIPGRSGSLTMDNGRWNDVTVTYDCAILSGFGEEGMEFLGRLAALRGHQVLTDTVYPDRYRLAVLSEPVEPESFRKNEGGFFSLSFLCKPQRFLVSGDTALTLTASGTVTNATAFVSKPIITVYGTGPGSLTVGEVTVQINALTDQITLDCDTMNAWRQVGDGAAQNKNGDIYAMEFPSLQPGDNLIGWTGSITKVEIIPRWWTL